MEAMNPPPVLKKQGRFNEFVRSLMFTLRDPVLLVSVVAVMIVVVMFIIIPLIVVLRYSFQGPDGFTLESYIRIFRSHFDREIVLNTIVLGVTVSFIGTAVAFLFAYANVYLKIAHKPLFKVLSILPMISPPFVISLATILLFGRSGLISYGLFGVRHDVHGFGGLVMTQVLSFFPVGYLMLVTLLQNIDPSIEEAAQALGSNQRKVFTKITLPLMLPGLANASLLIFIQSVADFGNAIVIGGNFNTLAVQIYMQAIGAYDMTGAMALAVVLLIISLLAFYLQYSVVGKKSYVTLTGKAAKTRALITNKAVTIPVYIACMAISLFVISLYIMIPFGAFVTLWGVDFSLTFRWIIFVFDVGGRFIRDTLILSVIATPIAALLGIVAAFLIVRKNFPGRRFLEASILMAIALPGTVLGLGYVYTYNTGPIILTGTAFILIVALVIRSMPVGTRTGIAALKQIDPSIEEAASICGAGSQKVFTSITVPLIRPVVFASLVYAFIRGMTLVSTIIFLVSARWNMLTVAIMSQVDMGRFGPANAYCLILIVLVGFVMLVMSLILKKMGINLNEGY